MTRLLEIGQSYVNNGRVTGIRLSTRPDYISEEIIDILKSYAVKTVELGIQSVDPIVLERSKRGHTREHTENACRLIKESGFELIGQMMVGLPGSDVASEIETARVICSLGANGARVYPTVVFYDTELCNMAIRGEYIPLDEASAIERTKEVLKVFDANDVPCIRVGLCASENLSSEEAVYGGANQSSIGEMAIGEIFYERMDKLLSEAALEKASMKIAIFSVPMGCTSKAVGQKRRNILRICEKYSLLNVKIVEKNCVLGYNISLESLA